MSFVKDCFVVVAGDAKGMMASIDASGVYTLLSGHGLEVEQADVEQLRCPNQWVNDKYYVFEYFCCWLAR